MAILRIDFNSEAVAAQTRKALGLTEAETVAENKASQAEHEKDLLEWLSLYDSDGHRIPGTENKIHPMFELRVSFIAKSPEEQAAYIIAEKKRLGVL